MMKEGLEIKERSVFVPFVLGGLVGAGIALLLAPKSGKEVRKNIKDIAENTRETIISTMHRGKDLIEEGKIAVSSAIDAGKAAYVHEREQHLKAV
jgi:gas vesicle protein